MTLPATTKSSWPLISTVVVFALVLTWLTMASVSHTGGRLIYALDDPYIHMAMAKNLVEHGVWGVTRYEFTSTSSSILWTILISGVYLVVGVNDTVPYVLNVLFSAVLLSLLYVILKKHDFSSALIVAALFIVAVAAPLPALVFSGMEHVLQTVAALALTYLVAQALGENRRDIEASRWIGIALLSAATILIRFEGMFLILVIGTLLLMRRRLGLATAVVVSAVVPIVIFQLISVKHGWFLLPNSVLLRAGLLDSPGPGEALSDLNVLVLAERLVTFVFTGIRNIAGRPHILAVLLPALLLFILRFRKTGILWDTVHAFFFIVVGAILMQMQFIRREQFFRYEAYLIVLGLSACALLCTGLAPRSDARTMMKDTAKPVVLVGGLLFVIMLFPLIDRGVRSAVMIPTATKNIYEQQYQMARFFGEFYAGEAIAANDVGAINYYTDIRCLDLIGLASVDVARKRRERRYGTPEIDTLTQMKGVRVAILYDHWFRHAGVSDLPPRWSKVARWVIRNNVVCDGDTVSIYAIPAEESAQLRKNLEEFVPKLPKHVTHFWTM